MTRLLSRLAAHLARPPAPPRPDDELERLAVEAVRALVTYARTPDPTPTFHADPFAGYATRQDTP